MALDARYKQWCALTMVWAIHKCWALLSQNLCQSIKPMVGAQVKRIVPRRWVACCRAAKACRLNPTLVYPSNRKVLRQQRQNTKRPLRRIKHASWLGLSTWTKCRNLQDFLRVSWVTFYPSQSRKTRVLYPISPDSFAFPWRLRCLCRAIPCGHLFQFAVGKAGSLQIGRVLVTVGGHGTK